jgi:WD40 repeat protein
VVASVPTRPAVRTISVSRDGKSFVTTSPGGDVKLWRLADLTNPARTRAREFQSSAQPLSASMSPDGRSIVTAGVDGVARVIDAATLRSGVTLSRRGALYGAVFSPDGRHVLSFGADGTAQIWDPRVQDRSPSVLRGHTGAVTAGAFSPDGRLVVTGSADNSTRVWRVRDGKLLSTHEIHSDSVTSVAFGPGKRIVSASDDRTARVYQCATCRTDDQLMRLKWRVFRNLTPDESTRYGDLLDAEIG